MDIISADNRLAERRGAKIVIIGPVGVGKTSLLRTLDLNRSFLDFHRMPSKAPSSMVGYSIVVHAILLAAALLERRRHLMR